MTNKIWLLWNDTGITVLAEINYKSRHNLSLNFEGELNIQFSRNICYYAHFKYALCVDITRVNFLNSIINYLIDIRQWGQRNKEM